MPTLRRFARCKIAIYADDHYLPHFHIEGRGFRGVVEIETMILRAGTIAGGREAMEWATANRDALRAEWERLNRRR